MNRRIILAVCLLCALGAIIVGAFWTQTNEPGPRELEYREKEEAASRNAAAAIDMAHESAADPTVAVTKVSEYQSESDEAKRYGALADLEMNRRTIRNQRLIGAAAVLGLLGIASAAVLCLPRHQD
jgi:hypothetical protein